jgi:hypothetical protein
MMRGDKMTDIRDLKTKRKDAYDFIWAHFNRHLDPWRTKTDESLASALDVPISELLSLKEGRANPTPKLIKGVINLFEMDPTGISKDELDLYLIKPFK